jgi:hypothetical protein
MIVEVALSDEQGDTTQRIMRCNIGLRKCPIL